jgi:ribosomal protein S18 acetylase RimI-like enzyme
MATTLSDLSSEMHIRKAQASDAADLVQLAEHTFVATYGPHCDPSMVHEHCQKNFGMSQQLVEIQNANGITLLQFVGDELIGFVQMKQVDVPQCVKEETEAKTICLHRYYVKQNWHGKGVALILLEQAIEHAKASGAQAMWLGMWRHNQRAFAFYQKHGFNLVGEMEYVFGTQVELDQVLLKVF